MRHIDSAPAIVRMAFIALSLVILADALPTLLQPNMAGYVGVDRLLYLEATERWLRGGPFYEAYQLAGPYDIAAGAVLYPPVAIWLFLPFTVLPFILWWAIPLGLTGWAIWHLRPALTVWPLLAMCIAWPPTVIKVATGNPVIWAMAAVAVGVVITGPAVFALIKPSLFPFALWGVRRRRWWAFLLLFVAMAVPFGTMWFDWMTVVWNSLSAPGVLLYSIQEAPLLLLPIIAGLGASARRDPLLSRQLRRPWNREATAMRDRNHS